MESEPLPSQLGVRSLFSRAGKFPSGSTGFSPEALSFRSPFDNTPLCSPWELSPASRQDTPPAHTAAADSKFEVADSTSAGVGSKGAADNTVGCTAAARTPDCTEKMWTGKGRALAPRSAREWAAAEVATQRSSQA